MTDQDPARRLPHLHEVEGRLGLEGEAGRLEVDFVGGRTGHRLRHGGGRGQTLARAVGAGKGRNLPRILDATAGLGRDAAVLATIGCPVLAVERQAPIFALLADGLARALADEETAALLGGHLQILEADATQLLDAWAQDATATPLASFVPEVIYLDPMHPPRRKAAQVRKEMRVFRDLVGIDEDQQQLLAAALGCAVERVVVKRPMGADALLPGVAQRLSGKTTCYDLYLRPKKGEPASLRKG